MATKKTMSKGDQKLKKEKYVSPQADYRTQIVVRFHDYVVLPYQRGVEKQIEDFRVGPWSRLAKKHPGISIEPLFANIDPKKLKLLITKAEKMDPDYKAGDFFKYFKVKCPVLSDSKKILENLASWTNIRNVYFNPVHSAPALVTYSDDTEAASQLYLDQAPQGVSAKTVWDADTPGSLGTGVKLIDIEKGWKLDHSDLPASPSIPLISGNNIDAGKAHGTSVLGIICALDNTESCVGLAPEAGVSVISSDPSGVAPAIVESLFHLGFGDVLLIEETNIEDNSGTPCSVPVETTDAEFDAIRLATALGIIVIEPGGNGNGSNIAVNFNDFVKNIAGIDTDILNTSSINFKDSGAIIVTASKSVVTPDETHEKLDFAPIGSRIDCYALGEGIVTLSTDSAGGSSDITTTFSGTSAAAAIIAGTVLSMQAMAVQSQGYRFSPGQMRAILHNPLYGTDLSTFIPFPLPGHYESFSIYMPDLQKYAQDCLNAYPDLYLRDFAGDIGDPHSGSIARSPDIIVKNLPSADPVADFGDTSPDRDSDVLCDLAYTGENNYIYVRVLNRGGVVGENVCVKLYYSLPATLLTPSLLTHIADIAVPDVPVNNILTVSPEYIWNTVPATGHYCFVGIVMGDKDPVLDLSNLPDWDWATYRRFIRDNNNVTWRNFNVVGMPPPPAPMPDPEPEPQPGPEPEPDEEEAPGQIPDNELPKQGWMALEFLAPGLPDKNELMHLEVLSQLPGKAIVMLEMPLSWKRGLFKGSPYIRTNLKKKISYKGLGPCNNTKIENIKFKANSRTPLKLFINIPEKLRHRKYDIAVRQMLGKEELGRVTWRLIPSAKKISERIVKPTKVIRKKR